MTTNRTLITLVVLTSIGWAGVFALDRYFGAAANDTPTTDAATPSDASTTMPFHDGRRDLSPAGHAPDLQGPTEPTETRTSEEKASSLSTAASVIAATIGQPSAGEASNPPAPPQNATIEAEPAPQQSTVNDADLAHAAPLPTSGTPVGAREGGASGPEVQRMNSTTPLGSPTPRSGTAEVRGLDSTDLDADPMIVDIIPPNNTAQETTEDGADFAADPRTVEMNGDQTAEPPSESTFPSYRPRAGTSEEANGAPPPQTAPPSSPAKERRMTTRQLDRAAQIQARWRRLSGYGAANHLDTEDGP